MKPLVVFVDDEENVLAGLRRSFRDKLDQWNMLFFSDPEAALSTLAVQSASVVVTDIRMPSMNGIELARRLGRLTPAPTCIVLSGSTDFDLAVSSINDARVFRYLLKPCDTDSLSKGIAEALLANTRKIKGTLDEDDDPQIESSTLELIPYGVVVVDAEARVQFTNRRAVDILQKTAALFVGHDNLLRGGRAPGTQALETALKRSFECGEVSALSLVGDAESPLRITVQPYFRNDSGKAPLACLFLFSDLERVAPEPRLLREMFGLTISESRLAVQLARGLPIDEAAEECGLTRSSARTYLKNIFAKVGVSRQAELVRTILVSIAPN